MPELAVNVDHIATIREARRTDEPDPVHAISAIEIAGAHGIVMHLRQDRRHIQERDLELALKITHLPVNLEMAPVQSMADVALKYHPFTVTLVPESTSEITTEGGLNLSAQTEHLNRFIRHLKTGIRELSLFINPDETSIRLASELGAHGIELHTGRYAEADSGDLLAEELERIRSGAALARKLGLRVRAGHGLTYRNVRAISRISDIDELSIGHSIIARCIWTGMERAVRDMLALIGPDCDQ